MPTVRFTGKRLDPATIAALVSGTLVNGSKPSAWWRRQSNDFRNMFMDTVRTSMRNGESLTQAITRVTGGTIDGVTVPGIMRTTKGKAGALVSTSMSAVTNEAALQSFQANNDVIKAITQVSTLDNKTSDVCIAYSGQSWDINTLAPVAALGSTLPYNGGPPRHFNCRSRLRPVTKSFKELGIDKAEIPPGTRASMDGQVPADITFNQFLKKKPNSFQNKLLGPKRAQLWRDGDITLTQLVDMRGNPLTISQLEQRIGMVTKPLPPPTARATGSLSDDFFVETDVPGIGTRVFTKDAQGEGGRDAVLVLVPRKTFEEGWKKSDLYIPPDLSKNTIGTRMKQFDEFIKDEPIIKSGLTHVDELGQISFTDGRHRTRYLLNTDMKQVPVTMTRESAENLSKHYGLRLATRTDVSIKDVERVKQLEKKAKEARVASWKQKRAERRERVAREEKRQAERRAKREAERAAKAEAARKEAEAAEKVAREAAEKAAQAEAARKEAEAARRAAETFSDPKTIRKDMYKLFAKEGIDEKYFPLVDDVLDMFELSTRINIDKLRQQMLIDKLRERVERRLAVEAKVAAQAKNAVKEAPDFKNLKEVKQWFEKNLVNPETTFGQPVGSGGKAFTGDIKAWKLTANITLMMRDRFGMKLPNYIGMRAHHPYGFKQTGANAAVHMETDSLLLIKKGFTANERLLQSWSQHYGYFGGKGESGYVRRTFGKKSYSARNSDGKRQQLRDEFKAKVAAETDPDLKAAMQAALDDDDIYLWTVRGHIENAEEQYWRTIIHESGHRLHGQHFDEVNGILAQIQQQHGRISKYNRPNDWVKVTSEYAGHNEREFLAEQFTMYMTGRHKRVHPLLLKFFKRVDKGGEFDEALFKQHMRTKG